MQSKILNSVPSLQSIKAGKMQEIKKINRANLEIDQLETAFTD